MVSGCRSTFVAQWWLCNATHTHTRWLLAFFLSRLGLLKLNDKMASFSLSMFMTDIAGKVGGTTTQRSRFGHTAMNASRPPRVYSQVQADVRGTFAFTSTAWRGLSESDRIQWRGLAGLSTRISRLGVTYVPSGYQLFMECMLNARAITPSIILSPPPSLPVLPVISDFAVGIDESAVLATATWNYSGGSLSWFLLLYAIACGNGSKQVFPFSPVIVSRSFDLTTGSATFDSRKPASVGREKKAGNLFFYAYRFVEDTTGFATPMVYADATVGP